MKRKAILMLGAALLAPMLFLSGVAAHEGDSTGSSGTDDKTTSSQVATDTSQEDKVTTTSTDNTSLLERLAKRKTERKTKLTSAEQKHILGVCKNAQGKATSTNAKVNGLSTSRGKVYKNLTTKLNELVAKLQAKDVDVTQLQAEIVSLQTQIDTFNTDLAAYKQSVNDLVAMDCSSDPVAFKASLDAARAAREKAVADSTAIKAYVKDTIKPTLQQIRSELEKTETPATTPTTTEGN